MTTNKFCLLFGHETPRCISFLGEGDFLPFKHPKFIWVLYPTLVMGSQANSDVRHTFLEKNPRKTCFLGHTFFFLTLGIAWNMLGKCCQMVGKPIIHECLGSQSVKKSPKKHIQEMCFSPKCNKNLPQGFLLLQKLHVTVCLHHLDTQLNGCQLAFFNAE